MKLKCLFFLLDIIHCIYVHFNAIFTIFKLCTYVFGYVCCWFLQLRNGATGKRM